MRVFAIIILSIVSMISCARRGSPSGGKKDVIAPKMIDARPLNHTVNFAKNEIKIYFDEYIRLKNPNNNIVISPPLSQKATIYPKSSPRKNIYIRFNEKLKENTTYTIDFGSSIEDNNEGNKFEGLSYTFSTGSVLDSLSLSGKISYIAKTNFKKDKKNNIVALLYKVKNYKDSSVYNQIPDYVGLVKKGVFSIKNIAKGKYKVLAIEDINGDYKYQPFSEKIAFANSEISTEKDSIAPKMILFKETQKFKVLSPSQKKSGRIDFAFQGDSRDVFVKKTFPKGDVEIIKNNDSISVWHNFKNSDSLSFYILKNKKTIDTLAVKVIKKDLDSLSISKKKSNLLFEKGFSLLSNNIVKKIDKSKIKITKNDSLNVDYEIKKIREGQELKFNFKTDENSKYSIEILPNSILDFFKFTNKDTIKYSYFAKSKKYYGTLNLNLKNSPKPPFFIELSNAKSIVREKYIDNLKSSFVFEFLNPGKYFVKIKIDSNKNKKWDTGSFVKKTQPEKIISSKEIEVKSEWITTEDWILK